MIWHCLLKILTEDPLIFSSMGRGHRVGTEEVNEAVNDDQQSLLRIVLQRRNICRLYRQVYFEFLNSGNLDKIDYVMIFFLSLKYCSRMEKVFYIELPSPR